MNNFFLETLRCEDGEVKHLHYHQLRFKSVLSSLGVRDIPKLSHSLCPPKRGVWRCRVLYSKESLEISYHPYIKRKIEKLKIINISHSLEYAKKYANRDAINALFEKREEADDILMLRDSLVCDTSIANLAFYKNGIWYTPLNPLLKGTTRARYIQEGKLVPKEIFLKDLGGYSQVALLNSMRDFDIIEQKNIRKLYC